MDFEKLTDENIKVAVDLWINSEEDCKWKYGNISDWNTSRVTNMSYLFYNQNNFNENILKWDVSNVTNMNSMFYGATSFNSRLNNWNVSNVTNMSYMFYQATSFNCNLSDWNVSNVEDMSYMFYEAPLFNCNISNWNVSNVTDMSFMFFYARSFNCNLNNWNVSNVIDMSHMFSVASSFNGDISNWDVSNVTDTECMFYRCNEFCSDLRNWNVSNVSNMNRMFYEAISFRSDLSGWDVKNVIDMIEIFKNARSFYSDLSRWNVTNVKHSIHGLYKSSKQGHPLNEETSNPLSIFPNLGIKLSYLNKFIRQCGGRKSLQNYTTNQVCQTFIFNNTLESKTSYCEWLILSNQIEAVGEPNVFISHAWNENFLDVVNVLFEYLQGDEIQNNNDNDNNINIESKGDEILTTTLTTILTPTTTPTRRRRKNIKEEQEIIIWFDIFSINQHNNSNQQVSDDYWYDTFRNAIKKFGRTVMVLSPWNNPVPLRRAWCLWELYCTVITGSKFEIAMTNQSKDSFFEDILSHPQKTLTQILGTIDVERSECFLESDKERIFSFVRETIGFLHLNELIFERLRYWVIEMLTIKCNHLLLDYFIPDDNSNRRDMREHDRLQEQLNSIMIMCQQWKQNWTVINRHI